MSAEYIDLAILMNPPSLLPAIGYTSYPYTGVEPRLCAKCNPAMPEQFDCYSDPGFVFAPVDIDFFIDYEMKDGEYRKCAADQGLPQKRAFPTSAEYKKS
ncbi:hypothetical protein DTO271D3_8565 [Paecilomyces variotii]|nr:hypothetical protein DTO169E5_6425 [Paecilomyces variotii]KAJ9311195.1 hypothetical protein DTO271D3_8565 [Paecilomyces variotii]